MLSPTWPGRFFWFTLGYIFSFMAVIASSKMEMFKKDTPGTVILNLTMVFSCFGGNALVGLLAVYQSVTKDADNPFRGCESVGKSVGATLLLLGNIGVYYYSEKSIACLLSFLFLALSCLCTHCLIQPCTNFGLLEFLLSACLNEAVTLFGLRIYTWLTLIACIIIACLPYLLGALQSGAATMSQDLQVRLQEMSSERIVAQNGMA